MMNEHRDRVMRHIQESIEIQELLFKHGRKVVQDITKTISVRELGRRTGLSSTYISMVRTGAISISPSAFLKVCRELDYETILEDK